jgi:hypothetical protein
VKKYFRSAIITLLKFSMYLEMLHIYHV